MSDAALAAVSGLLGVGLSGGVQVGLEVWNAHKIRRAAVRPVESEIVGIITLLVALRDHLSATNVLPEPDVWRAHQEVLSRELSDRKWNWLSAAYASYEALLTLNQTLQESETEESRAALVQFLDTATVTMDKAHRSLSHRGWRGARSTNKSFVEKVDELRSA